MGIDGERLKKLHLSRGLPPGQIADKLGISRQGISTEAKIDNKHTKKPPRRTAIKGKRAFRIWISK